MLKTGAMKERIHVQDPSFPRQLDKALRKEGFNPFNTSDFVWRKV
jgi:hypothetical protein